MASIAGVVAPFSLPGLVGGWSSRGSDAVADQNIPYTEERCGLARNAVCVSTGQHAVLNGAFMSFAAFGVLKGHCGDDAGIFVVATLPGTGRNAPSHRMALQCFAYSARVMLTTRKSSLPGTVRRGNLSLRTDTVEYATCSCLLVPACNVCAVTCAVT